MSVACVETEQKAALADAREDGEVLALARRASEAGTWDLDMVNGTVRYCPRSLEILGHPRDRSPVLTAAEWAQHIFPGDAERVLAEGRQARQEGRILISEYRIVEPDGGTRWVRALGRTLHDANGDAVRCVGLNFDITEEKEAEAASRRMQAQLAQASRLNAMATMAETLAHELNQPLTAISGYLSGARALLKDSEAEHAGDVGDAFDGAIKASLRAADIIRSLRALTRRSSDTIKPTALDVAIRQALELGLPAADQRHIQVRAELEPGLSAAIDELQFQQVIYNLLRNAIDAVESAPAKRIEISCRRSGDAAVIRVEDSGAGVPEAVRERLFDSFVTTKAGAVGVGLAISRTIVEAHEGKLWAEHLAGGTAFCLTLPLVLDSPDPADGDGSPRG